MVQANYAVHRCTEINAMNISRKKTGILVTLFVIVVKLSVLSNVISLCSLRPRSCFIPIYQCGGKVT